MYVLDVHILTTHCFYEFHLMCRKMVHACFYTYYIYTRSYIRTLESTLHFTFCATGSDFAGNPLDSGTEQYDGTVLHV